MNTATGMKLDTQIVRMAGLRRAALQAIVLAGLAGVATSTPANDFSGLADPTQPAYRMAAVSSGPAAKPMGPMLQSTFISASQRRAVISGRSYVVGDKFGGGTITEIQPYEVVLKTAGRESRLRLLPKLVKETSVVKVPANSQEGGQNEKLR